jgi:hypothetical protein
MSPIAASKAHAVTKLTPGRVINRRSSGETSTSSASALDRSHFTVEEVDPAQAGLDHLALVCRQLLRGKPAPTSGAKQVGCRRASVEVADQDRVHLVLLPGALPHQLRAAGDPSTQDACLFVRRPHLGQKPRRQQPRQRARVELVGLRRPRRILDRLRISEHDTIDVGLDDPGDRHRNSRSARARPDHPQQGFARTARA